MGVIATAAATAWQAKLTADTETDRTTLGTALTPLDVSTLTVAASQDGVTVFTDGSLYLSVDTNSQVFLVTDEAGWTKRTGPLTNLAALGQWLAATNPPAVSAWAAGVAYAIGDKVTYQSVVYVCQQAHTSQVGWEPPATPALWKTA